MAAKIKNSYGSISSDDISKFEARRSLVLPEEYRRFLLSFNGGEPIPAVFKVPGWAHKRSSVDWFFGIHGGEHSNLEQEYEFWTGRLPPEIIAIGNDPFGNLICLGIAGKRRGRVYFWDHEDEFDQHGEGRQDYGNVYLLANSLGEFLDKLQDLT